MPPGVALDHSLPLLVSRCQRGRGLGQGFVFLQGVVELQACFCFFLFAPEFLLVNFFFLFALVWCETLSYGVRHMLPLQSLS